MNAPLVPTRPSPAAPRTWWRLFFSRTTSAGSFYDLLGEHVLAASGDLANMGLWRGARTLAEANVAMFDLVLDSAGLAPGQLVVDAGCGFGTLARRCVQRHQVRRVVGLNLSTVQLQLARRRAAGEGLEARLEFLEASATEMPLADATVDRVLSTEAAFHFEPRADFFREAARVLKPGGRLALVDLLAPPPRSWGARVLQDWARRGVRMPACNVVTPETLRAQVEAAGLEVLSLQSIAPDVVRPFRRWFLGQPLRELLRYPPGMMLATAPWMLCDFDYVHLVARRP